jgi:hypothetical protein
LQIADLVDFHEVLHDTKVLGTALARIKLSSDGVQECNSNSVSIDVISIKFENCKAVYVVSAVRTRPGKISNIDEVMREVVQEIK